MKNHTIQQAKHLIIIALSIILSVQAYNVGNKLLSFILVVVLIYSLVRTVKLLINEINNKEI